MMLIFAHRGASAVLPENTLPAFERAIASGADGTEFDIRATKDGELVILHDRAIDRTTDGSGNVDEMTLAELQRFDAGGGQPVPTFERLLALVNGRFELDIEIKQANVEHRIIEILEPHPNVRWSASSFDWDVLRAFRAAAPDANLLPLSMFGDDAVFEAAQEIGASGLALYFAAITEDVIDRANAENLKILAWTVNDFDEARRLERLGVYALCTDHPEEMVQAFKPAS
jgi:glycerophosphoryl diester phosphodiesterase